MIPKQVILCCRDTTCIALYTYLDLRQGAHGRPPHGLQYIADHFGITFNTLREHLAASRRGRLRARDAGAALHQERQGQESGRGRGGPQPVSEANRPQPDQEHAAPGPLQEAVEVRRWWALASEARTGRTRSPPYREQDCPAKNEGHAKGYVPRKSLPFGREKSRDMVGGPTRSRSSRMVARSLSVRRPRPSPCWNAPSVNSWMLSRRPRSGRMGADPGSAADRGHRDALEGPGGCGVVGGLGVTRGSVLA